MKRGIDLEIHSSPRKKPRDLGMLFRPRSVAIVGCSSDLAKLSGRPLKFLLKWKYSGRIFPVNPKYEKIEGLVSYPSVRSLPEPADVALVLVPAAGVEAVLEDCVSAGVRSAIVFSSGFTEVGEQGSNLQQNVKEVAEKAAMPVLGPNCLGIINLRDGIPLSFTSVLEEEDLYSGGLALVSQSGAIASFILGMAREARVGFSHWVTTGNEASLELSEVAQYLLGSDGVNAVLCYLEEVRNPRGLIDAGDIARRTGKPLICLKVGHSTAGRKAALSHTGAIAGSDEEYEAFFRKAGIIKARHIEELLDLGIVLGSSWRPNGKRVAILSISGGGGIICADRCEEVGLEVPELNNETQSQLRQVVPVFGSVKNPVDMTAELVTTPGLLGKCLEIVLNDATTDSVLILLGANRKNAASLSSDIIAAVKESRRVKGKPILVIWMAAPSEAVEALRKANVPLLFDAVRAVDALARLSELPCPDEITGAYQKAGVKRHPTLLRKEVLSILSGIKPEYLNGETAVLVESAGKDLLARIGIPRPSGGLAETAEDAVKLANHIGYPVVAKVSSPDILHKSDARAVIVGINTPEVMHRSFEEIVQNARLYNPKASIEGVLIEETVQDAIEAFVGLKWSEKFGSLVMFGLGGIFVEIFRDVSLRLAPVNEAEAVEMIEELKAKSLFYGFRQFAERDVEATVRAIVIISELGATLGPDLIELDVNPLFVLKKGSGVKAGDALIRLRRLTLFGRSS